MFDPPDDPETRLSRELAAANEKLAAVASIERQLRAVFDGVVDALLLVDDGGRYVDVNAAATRLLGLPRERMLGMRNVELFPPEGDPEVYWAEFLRRGTVAREVIVGEGDSTRHFELRATANIAPGRHLAVMRDITDRKKAERAASEAEKRLRQAQKLEALGQLAGGVAHDFNNVLATILATTSTMLEDLGARDPMHADVAEIHDAAKRAADLTRQLLAFSRKQVLERKVIVLDEVVTALDRMFRRLLGEDIDVTLTLRARGATIAGDPGQLEQVILNLLVNAREAMPAGGRITIETCVERVSEQHAAELGVSPGTYAKLIVADTGRGMDESVRARVFEPFFTTKEGGRGAGLGLSTVFGIVRQSAGHVVVESTPGVGSTFSILLPALEGTAREGASSTSSPEGRGNETILLVEDEDRLRARIRIALVRAGYRVLEAANAGEALLVAEQHKERIDLLLTDVVMPRVGGHVLAKRLAQLRPETRVLYMSGYTDDAILGHGVEVGELAFLAKPFDMSTLAKKVRAVLDGEARAPASGSQKT